MSITQTQQQKSIKFVEHLNKLCGIIDDWSKHVPEGEYLESMNTLKDIFEFKDDLDRPYDNPIQAVYMTDPVIQQHVARTNLRIRPELRSLDDAEKLASGDYKCCKKCDRIIKNEYEREHLTTNVCWRTYRAKHLTMNIQEGDTSKYETIITRINGALVRDHNPITKKNWGLTLEF